MIGLACAAALAAPAPRLDRVDLLSESGARFLSEDLPRAGASPDVVALRWAEQVAVVGGLDRFTLSASLVAQTLAWEPSIGPALGPARLGATLGLHTRALLPDGALAGLSVRAGPARLGLSALLLSESTWSRPELGRWSVLPAVGLGVGRGAHAPAGG